MRRLPTGLGRFELRSLALRTLDRYIFREVASTWIAVSGVLLVILLSLQLSRVLSQAAANDFPREVVFSLIGLTSVGYLPIVVPIGFFLAIMLGLGRLYHESEMAAIQSCGVGPAGLFRPIAVLAALVTTMLLWLSFIAIPQAMTRAHEIRDAALRDAQFGNLEAGRFRTFGGGSVVFYAEHVDDNGVLHNVHVFVDRPPRTRPERDTTKSPAGNARPESRPAKPASTENVLEIWVATRAEQRGAGQSDQTFVLYDGRRYEGVPGEGEFRVIAFSEGDIPIRLGDFNSRPDTSEMKSTAALLASSDRRDVAELGARLSAPLMTVMLMLLAVPLSRLRPRQGRFGKLGIGILVYFIYALLLDAGRTWIENGAVPPFVGLWWVHGVALSVAVALLLRENPPARPRPAVAGT